MSNSISIRWDVSSFWSSSSRRLVTRRPRPPLPLRLTVWGMGRAVCSRLAISPPSAWREDGFSFGSSSAWRRASLLLSCSSPSTHVGASRAAPRSPSKPQNRIWLRYIYIRQHTSALLPNCQTGAWISAPLVQTGSGSVAASSRCRPAAGTSPWHRRPCWGWHQHRDCRSRQSPWQPVLKSGPSCNRGR